MLNMLYFYMFFFCGVQILLFTVEAKLLHLLNHKTFTRPIMS